MGQSRMDYPETLVTGNGQSRMDNPETLVMEWDNQEWTIQRKR